jgi:hypothetical protein
VGYGRFLLAFFVKQKCCFYFHCFFCRWICSCMNSWVRSDQRRSRFSRAFDDTRQMIQCCSLFTSIINICSS